MYLMKAISYQIMGGMNGFGPAIWTNHSFMARLDYRPGVEFKSGTGEIVATPYFCMDDLSQMRDASIVTIIETEHARPPQQEDTQWCQYMFNGSVDHLWLTDKFEFCPEMVFVPEVDSRYEGDDYRSKMIAELLRIKGWIHILPFKRLPSLWGKIQATQKLPRMRNG